MRTSLLVSLLVLAFHAFGGYDESVSARAGEWDIRVETVGTESGTVVTRVTAKHTFATDIEAHMELPETAFHTLLTHLNRLPKQRLPDHSSKRPKGDFVIVSAERDSLVSSPAAIALVNLWLELHRANWQSPSTPGMEQSLRTQSFPIYR